MRYRSIQLRLGSLVSLILWAEIESLVRVSTDVQRRRVVLIRRHSCHGEPDPVELLLAAQLVVVGSLLSSLAGNCNGFEHWRRFPLFIVVNPWKLIACPDHLFVLVRYERWWVLVIVCRQHLRP